MCTEPDLVLNLRVAPAQLTKHTMSWKSSVLKRKKKLEDNLRMAKERTTFGNDDVQEFKAGPLVNLRREFYHGNLKSFSSKVSLALVVAFESRVGTFTTQQRLYSSFDLPFPH